MKRLFVWPRYLYLLVTLVVVVFVYGMCKPEKVEVSMVLSAHASGGSDPLDDWVFSYFFDEQENGYAPLSLSIFPRDSNKALLGNEAFISKYGGQVACVYLEGEKIWEIVSVVRESRFLSGELEIVILDREKFFTAIPLRDKNICVVMATGE